MAPRNYNSHPYKDCTHAIGSRNAADGSPRLAGATPVPAGDETAWPVGELHCRRDKEDRPHEEEKSRAILCVEDGIVTLVTSSRGSLTSPPRKNCRREPKLLELPERARTSSSHPSFLPDHLLAAMAGQVVRSHRREAELV
jgi:hypothetical protein